MNERSVYAHWLDPDYLEKHVLPSGQIEERTLQFQGFLKMHAIAGDSIHISDVQLVESRALLLSFADPAFREFLDAYPGFLRLIAKPDPRLGARSERLAIITSGLARIDGFGESYIPNTYDSRSLVPHVAELFQGLQHEGDAERLFGLNGRFTQFLAGYDQPDRSLVEGLFFALKHFLKNSAAPVPLSSGGGATSYFEELEKSLSDISVDDSVLRSTLVDTMALAEQANEKRRRSLILAKLSHSVTIGHPDREKYILIAQAWNVAVGSAMGADCDSAYCFRNVAPIPIHSGLVPGRATFTVRMGAEEELFESIPHYDWHPALLEWKTILKVRKACDQEIRAYQNSLASLAPPADQNGSSQIDINFAALAKVGSQIIAEDQSRLSPPQWVMQTFESAGSMDSALNTLAFLPGVMKVKVVTKAIKTGYEAFKAFKAAFITRDRRLLRGALERFGQQYNLHRASARVGSSRPPRGLSDSSKS